MDERDDYAEPAGRRGSPLLALAFVGLLVILAVLPILPFLWLVVSGLLGWED